MREPVLKAVANPPKLFWAPFLPAAANFAVQAPMIFISTGLWQTNPILFVPSIILGHIILIGYGAKEPHLSAMMRSQGPMPGSTNVHKCKGRKFAP